MLNLLLYLSVITYCSTLLYIEITSNSSFRSIRAVQAITLCVLRSYIVALHTISLISLFILILCPMRAKELKLRTWPHSQDNIYLSSTAINHVFCVVILISLFLSTYALLSLSCYLHTKSSTLWAHRLSRCACSVFLLILFQRCPKIT